MDYDKEDETTEGNPKEDKVIERSANEDGLQQTPTKRMCYVTSPTVRAANATRSKYRRIRNSPLNVTARKLLLSKLERVKSNSQSKLL